jgi:nitrogen fixation/metabolism regulation signal transduction histidine kinase
VSGLFGAGADSAEVAAALAGREESAGRIDGFMPGRAHSAAGEPRKALAAFTTESRYHDLVNRREIVARPSPGGSPELLFYETADPGLLLAVWRPGLPDDRTAGSDPQSAARPVLFYKNIDSLFLSQAEQLLAGRQIFAQLRLTQGELNRSFLYPFIVIYAVMLLLALSLALFMAERLAGPIRHLARGTRIVGAGDWSYREQARTGGETGLLIEGFNNMIGRLEEQQSRLIDMEKMAAWREMARRLAHEIKNPLLPIRLTVQELKDQYRGDDPSFSRLLADSTRVVGDELDSLKKLVKEFSSFTRLPEMNPRPGSLPQLIEDVSRLYTRQPVKITADPAIPETRFDPDQLRRVLVNLFENSSAALEDQPDGLIQIDLAMAGENVEIRFADNGPGIPPPALPKIFDPYYTTRPGGTGLGLAMVKNIILLHGGSISAASTLDKGTVFTIRIPVGSSGREDMWEPAP